VEVIQIADIQKTVAMVFGAVLLLVGILGFVPNPLIGDASTSLFGVNMFHNVLHLVGGALGIWLGNKGSGRAFNQWLGYIAAVVAVLGFIPPTAALLASLLGANLAISVLHAAIAVVTLGVVYGVKE
jgi:hypothetical protein